MVYEQYRIRCSVCKTLICWTLELRLPVNQAVFSERVLVLWLEGTGDTQTALCEGKMTQNRMWAHSGFLFAAD